MYSHDCVEQEDEAREPGRGHVDRRVRDAVGTAARELSPANGNHAQRDAFLAMMSRSATVKDGHPDSKTMPQCVISFVARTFPTNTHRSRPGGRT